MPDKSNDPYTITLPETTRPASVLYDGAPQPYEDPADYLPRGMTIRGEVIA